MSEKMKKATKESLIARAQAKKANEIKYIEYDCKAIGETLMIKKLPITRIADIMDMTEEDSLRANMELNAELIYASVPLFHDKELQEAYDCKEPTEIVMKVLDDDLGEMNRICNRILDMYGLADTVEDIKN